MSTAYRFCPYCGAPLDRPPGVVHPACHACGRVFYQNPRPCVGTIIVRDGSILLIRRGVEPFKDNWDIPGGFLDPGEPPVRGACREAREETGLEVDLTGLVGIYMDTYPEGITTVNIFYEARPVGGRERADDDAVETRWFPRDALPPNIAFDCCRAAIHDWLRRGALPLPD